jgi:zinc transport system ATP-binding protein
VAADPVLAFEGVELRRGRRAVLAGLGFAVEAGQAWFLVGRNGAGKSTLLAAALGALHPARGRIERAPGLADHSELGFVPQRCTLDPTLPTTVAEFVELGLVGLGLGGPGRRLRVADGLAAVGLDGHGRRSFWGHSEGQRQRILLARALARRPRHLLMDEPTASLDPTAALRFWNLVGALHRDHGLTVICATHDLDAVARLGTHTALCVAGPDPDAAGRVQVGPTDRSGASLRAAFALAEAAEARP